MPRKKFDFFQSKEKSTHTNTETENVKSEIFPDPEELEPNKCDDTQTEEDAYEDKIKTSIDLETDSTIKSESDSLTRQDSKSKRISQPYDIKELIPEYSSRKSFYDKASLSQGKMEKMELLRSWYLIIKWPVAL